MAHQFSSEFGSVPSLKRRLTPCDRLNHIDAAQTVSSASHIREGSDSGGAAGMPDRCRSDAQGPPLDVQPNANSAAYCGTLDFEFWLRKCQGEEMVTWLKKNVHPLDLVDRLAENHSIVLLNGGGFDAPNWSVRVSFVNLQDDIHDDIGRAVRAVGRSYVDTFNTVQKK
ncbi:hypothetical protein [Mesorhizobium sp.]|uniref:hypothetical protein n=1 Tax=Mesorhizobium sp. TaxID=1871066 RepID=UPI00338E5C0B